MPFDFAVRRAHMSTANRLFSIMQSVEDLALEVSNRCLTA